MKLKYVIGDATEPKGSGTKIIAHICNDAGGFGSGFVVALSNRWPIRNGITSPEFCYREWHERGNRFNKRDFVLGQIHTLLVEDDIFVCNMIAQRDYKKLEEDGQRLHLPNCKLSSLLECLTRLLIQCENSQNNGKDISIVAPRFGAGLGGEQWSRVETVINQVFGPSSIPFYVYDPKPVEGTVYDNM